jgi:hypothetical protein
MDMNKTGITTITVIVLILFLIVEPSTTGSYSKDMLTKITQFWLRLAVKGMLEILPVQPLPLLFGVMVQVAQLQKWNLHTPQ